MILRTPVPAPCTVSDDETTWPTPPRLRLDRRQPARGGAADPESDGGSHRFLSPRGGSARRAHAAQGPCTPALGSRRQDQRPEERARGGVRSGTGKGRAPLPGHSLPHAGVRSLRGPARRRQPRSARRNCIRLGKADPRPHRQRGSGVHCAPRVLRARALRALSPARGPARPSRQPRAPAVGLRPGPQRLSRARPEASRGCDGRRRASPPPQRLRGLFDGVVPWSGHHGVPATVRHLRRARSSPRSGG